MLNPTMKTRGERGVSGPVRRIAAISAAAVLFACSTEQILEVEDPDVAAPESITDSSAIPSVLAGAIGNVGAAINGGGDINQVALSGMISDEYINTETFPTRIEVDRRAQQYQSNGSLSGSFYAIQQARAAAELAADGYRLHAAATDVGLAQALNLAALTYVVMAENYCGAVPISRETSPGVFQFGPALSTRQLLFRVIEKADSALLVVGATSTSSHAQIARLLKARALLNLDSVAAAAAAINGNAGTGVQTAFKFQYEHSETTGRQNNGTWGLVQNSGRFGVATAEGLNGLTYRADGDTALATDANPATNPDPRVMSRRRPTNSGFGFDGATAMWWQLKYARRASKTTLVDGIEARLIEAEAALRSGNYLTPVTGTLAILNELRANAATYRPSEFQTERYYEAHALPALTAAGTLTAQQDQLFKERAYWLFLTSHRLGDMRRLTRPAAVAAGEIAGYGRAIESVFPTGNYHKGGIYGTDANSPIPQAEDNNPQFVRSLCQIGKP
jgi:starch-binding outer membrane protein, SusD/RagB family